MTELRAAAVLLHRQLSPGPQQEQARPALAQGHLLYEQVDVVEQRQQYSGRA
jgi:hypothetical protein